VSESSLFDCLPFYPIHPVQQRLPPCLLMRRAKKRPLAGMVAIDRYRFPHVRTDMAKHNFLYNRHDMTLREPIERVDKERKGPLPLVERAPHPLLNSRACLRILESGFTLPCMEGALSILNLPYQFDVPWKKVRLWWILFVLPFSCPRALVVRRLVKWAVPIRSGRCYT